MQHIVPTTASVAMPDQSVSASLAVEVMTDPDDGQLMLVAATQGNQGDLQVVTVAQAMAKVTAFREQADRAEALINEYAEKALIPAFLAEFGITLEELDTAALFEDEPKLAAAFQALVTTMDDGTLLVAVPKGQPAAERLAAIRALVLNQQKQDQA